MPWKALAGGAGSLTSGLFGFLGANQSSKRALQAQRETNEMNYKIWQEQQQHNIDMFNMENKANIDMFNRQNKANIDMFNMQNQAEIDMWNMNNAYNDPSAQVARMRMAGLNPSLMMGNNASGVATSSPHSADLSAGNLSSANAIPAGAPMMQSPSDSAFQSPLSAFGNGALNGLVQIAQAFNLFSDAGKKDKEGNNIEFMQPILQDYYQALSQESNAKRILANVSANTQSILNEYLPYEKQISYLASCEQLFQLYTEGDLKKQQLIKGMVDIFKTLSDISVNESEINQNLIENSLMGSQISLNWAEEKNTIADTEGKEKDNKLKDFEVQIKQAIVKPLISALTLQYQFEAESYQFGLDTFNPDGKGAGANIRNFMQQFGLSTDVIMQLLSLIATKGKKSKK